MLLQIKLLFLLYISIRAHTRQMGKLHSSLVWSLPSTIAQSLLKLDAKLFTCMVDAALRNPIQDIQFLLSQITPEGTPLVDLESEVKWGQERILNQPASPCPPLLRQILPTSRACFPLKLRNSQYYATNRVALVGDAAHTIHPLAGQGLNMGLLDVECLAKVIASAVETGGDIGNDTVLGEYTKERYLASIGMLLSCDSLNKLFSNDTSVLSSLRSFGLDSVNSLPWLKARLMSLAGA